MGAESSKSQAQVSPLNNCLRIERILAAGCDYLPPNRLEDTIRVGVIGSDQPQDTYSHQAIKIGDSKPYRLKQFRERSDSLEYTFEEDVQLTLIKQKDGFLYKLKTPQLDVQQPIYPGIVKMFKPIGMVSTELDQIAKFFR